MISAGDFRNGVTFEMDGQVVSIIEFQHVKPGKGAAFVRTKIRNDLYYFMDTETWEQLPINKSVLGDNFKFVKENMVCKVLSYKGNVFGVEPPNFVELTVTKTDPGFKGDTATNATKPAILETGAEIKVPLFIDEGEVIQIDTRTGEYMGRA
nr:elongation factor P [uncultured Ruminococcus sp.]